MEEEEREDAVVEIPIDGTLDLHTFNPKDVKDLMSTYIDECVKLGITEVRIIHGKGKGVLRRIVRASLERHPVWTDAVRHDRTRAGHVLPCGC